MELELDSAAMKTAVLAMCIPAGTTAASLRSRQSSVEVTVGRSVYASNFSVPSWTCSAANLLVCGQKLRVSVLHATCKANVALLPSANPSK